MRKRSFVLAWLAAFFTMPSFAQTDEVWTSFWNKDTTLLGYKDKNGSVKIEPKFTGFANATTFENIMAVSEEIEGKWHSYYLTKSGKTVGRDSLYIFDNSADCESEGFIRFVDPKTDRVGMYNRNGDVVIPAEYNHLSRVRNGLVIGLKGAVKNYWEQERHEGCHHFSWEGGQVVLVDTLNTLLVENFVYDNAIDFFALEKTKTIHPDTIRQSFLAKDGRYYSFVDIEKEFRQWLYTTLFPNLTKEKLIQLSYPTITWESKEDWVKSKSEKLIANNFLVLKNGLSEILQPSCDYVIASNGLNPFLFGGAEFKKYYNNCGEAKDWIYPTMSIIVSHQKGKDLSQNHYEFLRTDNGYKLLCLSIRDKKLK